MLEVTASKLLDELDAIATGEARHVFEMAKGLMERIAARMDENGNPKA